MSAASTDMTVRIGSLELPNPVLTAAGCGGSGRELAPFFDLTRIGAFTTASVTTQPRAGRPTPRAAETPAGLLTAVGLPGPGVEPFLERDLPWLVDRDVRTIVSVAGNSVEEFAEVARRLRGVPNIAAIEVNVACPNVADRGRMFGWHPSAAAAVVGAVRLHSRPGTPVLAKLAPDVTDIARIALACVDAGADGLTLVNTMEGMAIDPVTLRPALTGVSGGLSGPAIRPVAVRCVYQVHAALPDTPIIGVGGVDSGLAALEFILAGASAVALGTTLFHEPGAPLRVLRELEDALASRRIAHLADAVGLAHKPAGYVPPRVLPLPPGDTEAAADPGEAPVVAAEAPNGASGPRRRPASPAAADAAFGAQSDGSGGADARPEAREGSARSWEARIPAPAGPRRPDAPAPEPAAADTKERLP
ncbi:dihydroorotate dehydrogenase [Actinomadura harenae]|uniref:Dihydroorotate dehydrogenase n=1 Tax=Actinomadura harenae TaxID=2483351 RepID=A0A3M2LMJ5_9ACTN|nr:dihydroorotate dehydrogenase [Actinomadura harenae]RMI38661.1 dihydroorotate dehydrogenase [Actinomadura harenae]